MKNSSRIDINIVCADYGIKSILSLGTSKSSVSPDRPDHELKDKLVIMRVDFNLPMSACGTIVTDISRAISNVPTIKYLIACGAKILLLSHFGQPNKEVVNDPDLRKEYSFNKIIRDIEYTFDTKIVMIEPDDYQNYSELKTKIENTIKQNPDAQVFLLENIRFYQEEMQNNSEFAELFANLAYIYVNDAFSASHRLHASVCGIPNKMPPNKRFAGLGLLSELANLERYVGRFVNQNRLEPPIITAIVAGKKVSTKLPILETLAKKVDHLILGGAIANTFLRANGVEIGNSYYEENMIPEVIKLQQTSTRAMITLPADFVVLESQKAEVKIPLTGEMSIYSNNSQSIIKDFNKKNQITPKSTYKTVEIVNGNQQIGDLGPKTIENIKEILRKSDVLIWCGPLGIYENDNFRKGTTEIAKYISSISILENNDFTASDEQHNRHLISVAGGGDTIAALRYDHANDDIVHAATYCSTAGGAFLDWLCTKVLVGIEAITQLNK